TGLELSLRALFEHPTVESLAEILFAASQAQLPSIEAGEGAWEDDRVLSYGQVRLWTLDRIEGTSGNYNLPVSVRLTGHINYQALSQALKDVILRHEPLRTVVIEDSGEPIGRVLTTFDVRELIEYEDLSGLAELERDERVDLAVAADSKRPFDFSSDLMVRARLLRLSEQSHVFILVVHHSACDGTSIPLFSKDLSYAYSERLLGRAPAFKVLAVSYADHASWQRGLLEGTGELERQLEHWRTSLSGVPELLTLPTDFVRRADRSRVASQIPIDIDAKMAGALERLAQSRGTTIFTILMAVYGSLLGRLARQDDVVIGFPIEGRRTADIDELVGFFINTLSIRIDLAGSPNTAELIDRVKGRALDALVHQEIPFERLVEDLAVARSLLHAPIFQAWFNWQPQLSGGFSLEGLSEEFLASLVSVSRFDVLLSLAPSADGSISGYLEYDSSLFMKSTVLSWSSQFSRLIEKVVVDSQNPVASFCLINPSDRQKVLQKFNDTDRPVRSGTLPELFAAQVARTPDATALIFEEQR
ncbi:MAG: condensation domain-containing protein, partial [Rhodospirillales bacterium]